MKELAPWLNWIAGTIAMWGLFAPVPHDTVIRLLIIVPGMAIGLALIFRSEVSLEETNDDDGKEIDANARPNLNLMLLLPALALAARALFDIQFVEWLAPTLAGVTGGVTLALAVVWAHPELRTHWGSLALILVLTTAYAYGVLAHANKLYDLTQGERFETTVEDSRTRRPVPKTSLENHYVEVAPWGPNKIADEIIVGKDLYERLKHGDKICVDLHPGRFGWPWYEAKAC